MRLVKLNATESTNTFLKELSRREELDNFTVVVTNNQTKGRGQMNAVWNSEEGKNLIFSILIKDVNIEINDQFYISKAISLSIYECMTSILNVNTSIKWPNDILAGESKIAGILIENTVKKSKIKQSVVGVGVNVNQVVFKNLPFATSMKLITKDNFDLDLLLNKIIEAIIRNVELLYTKQFDLLDEFYLEKLYRLNVFSVYKDKLGNQFRGKIIGVAKDGKLQVKLENKKTHKFNLKEIEFVRL